MYSSWEIVLKDGTVLGESTLEYWDNIPQDKEIRFAVFTCKDGKKLMFKDFEHICIAKTGAAITGTNGTVHTGYAITEIKKDKFTTTYIKKDSIQSVIGELKDISMPKHVFRKGIVG